MIKNCLPGPDGVAFAFVPKVAATSIKFAVLEAKGITGVRKSDIHHHDALEPMTVAAAIQSGMRVFAMVRNPLDRLLAAWADKVLEAAWSRGATGARALRSRVGAQLGEDFATFVERLDPSVVLRDAHIMPQVALVPAGIWTGRIEDMPRSWNVVREHWPGLPALGRFNASRRPEFEIAPATAARVREIYAADHQAFGY